MQFKVIGNMPAVNSSPTSTYEVDQHGRLLPINKAPYGSDYPSIIGTGLFGIGLGFSLKTTDNLV